MNWNRENDEMNTIYLSKTIGTRKFIRTRKATDANLTKTLIACEKAGYEVIAVYSRTLGQYLD